MKDMEKDLKNILEEVSSYDKQADLKLIEKAYMTAKRFHSGQKRESGDEYIQHKRAPDVPGISTKKLGKILNK